jgi:tetratricopeptide (TPR) repeat protein
VSTLLTRTKDFFVTGGTLPPGAPSYVKRPADDELLRLVQESKLCYVLTPRQMGKSSLMVRTAECLRKQGVLTAVIDLTEIGTAPPREWYLSLLTRLQAKLGLSLDLQAWWQEHDSLAVVQRLVAYLREVVLTQIRGRVVVFLDEIDSTLNLNFRDDFFAAIRATYNARATEPEFNRLTFVLLGLATPDELMHDTARTPFNIGQPIDLGEFSRQDSEVLRLGLEYACPDKAGVVLDRILYWTGGHPYLTQTLCSSMLKVPSDQWNTDGVDGQVYQLFLSKDTRPDTNLQTIQRNVATNPRRGQLLSLYRKVYQGKSVADDTRSSDHNHLKLIGLVRAQQNLLKIRNEIYRRVFDLDWIKKNTPENWGRRIAVISTVLVVILAGIIAYTAFQQQQVATQTQAQVYIDNFDGTSSSDIRITSLAGLFKVQGKEDAARSLFHSLSQRDKLALFNLAEPKGVGPQLITVIVRLYTDLPNDSESNEMLRAMSTPLSKLDDPAARNLAIEIEQWLQGRARFNDGKYDQAVTAYNVAIRLNARNPGTLLDRALAYARQNQTGPALDDLMAVLKVNPSQPWKDRVKQMLLANPALADVVRNQKAQYSTLAALVP